MFIQLSFAAVFGLTSVLTQNESRQIAGVVVNGSLDQTPSARAEVVLRAGQNGEFIAVAKTVTDAHGQFLFDDLPADPEIVYIPGANRQGIHYPGPRMRLQPGAKAPPVKLTTYDAVTSPSPLVAERHE